MGIIKLNILHLIILSMIIFIFNSCSTLNYNQRIDFDKDDVYYESSDYSYLNDYEESHIFCLQDLRFQIHFMGNQKNILFSPLPVIPFLPFLGSSFNRNEDYFKKFRMSIDYDVYNEHNINIPLDKVKIILKDTILYSLEYEGDFTNDKKMMYRNSSNILIGHFMFSEFHSIAGLYFDIEFDKLGEFQLQFDSVKIDDRYTNITFPKMKITNRLVYRPVMIYTH